MPSMDFARGGYRYLPGVFQYSAGVAALGGFRIERASFRAPVPVIEGFRRAEHERILLTILPRVQMGF